MLFILLVPVVFTDRCTAASAQEKAVYSPGQEIPKDRREERLQTDLNSATEN
jgi:hypothetical protein